MKRFIKIIFSIFSLVFLFTLASKLPSEIKAQSPTPFSYTGTCSLASWNPFSRTMNVCVGSFQSISDLKATTGIVKCTGNSNIPYGSFCRDVQNNEFAISEIEDIDNHIIYNAGEGYYTCFDIVGIARAMGSADVIFYDKTGAVYCSIERIYTKPDDWDPLTEGLPWQTSPYHWGDDPTCANGMGINTAIGCLPVYNLNEFAKSLLRWGIGIAGGAALILIIVASFQIITSSGDPKRMQAGRELLTSAIAGLVLLIFSVLILDIIGIRLLNIPGFG